MKRLYGECCCKSKICNDRNLSIQFPAIYSLEFGKSLSKAEAQHAPDKNHQHPASFYAYCTSFSISSSTKISPLFNALITKCCPRLILGSSPSDPANKNHSKPPSLLRPESAGNIDPSWEI
ncbi:uncharacterized protein TrAtP1_003440 [Trichoderma atroviride]|uniref:uncharacterized protein n=1 Tax=Hypocrea atroviridis TaxID=63577 RepID=UPI003327D583|nr:hypothetical protein TrAtP1_003440 [Trichoderma atroviride]